MALGLSLNIRLRAVLRHLRRVLPSLKVIFSKEENQRLGLLIAFIFASLSAATLIFTGLFVARPGLWTKGFVNTTCTVLRYRQAGIRECTCINGASSRCRSIYPCMQVVVQYAAFYKNVTMIEMAMIHYEESIQSVGHECSYDPPCADTYKVNNRSAHWFVNTYGRARTSYNCFYHKENIKDVIILREFSESAIAASLAIPAVILTISGIAETVFLILLLKNRWKTEASNIHHPVTNRQRTTYGHNNNSSFRRATRQKSKKVKLPKPMPYINNKYG